jgi:hypothetical protein
VSAASFDDVLSMSDIVLRSALLRRILPARCRSSRFVAIATLIVDAVHIGSAVVPVRQTAPVVRSCSRTPIRPGRLFT